MEFVKFADLPSHGFGARFAELAIAGSGAGATWAPRPASGCEASSAPISCPSISASGRDRSARLPIHTFRRVASSSMRNAAGCRHGPGGCPRRGSTPGRAGPGAAARRPGSRECSTRCRATNGSRAANKCLPGRPVAAPDLQVAEQMVDRAAAAVWFGRRGDVAESVAGVTGHGRVLGQLDQLAGPAAGHRSRQRRRRRRSRSPSTPGGPHILRRRPTIR